MINLQRNPDEWKDPDSYIPERFDPESPYFLTPGGKKRNPMSFMPFLGGKRICLGKTFAEIVAKIVGPNLIMNFDFEYVDKKYMNFKVNNSVNSIAEPKVFVKIKMSSINFCYKFFN